MDSASGLPSTGSCRLAVPAWPAGTSASGRSRVSIRGPSFPTSQDRPRAGCRCLIPVPDKRAREPSTETATAFVRPTGSGAGSSTGCKPLAWTCSKCAAPSPTTDHPRRSSGPPGRWVCDSTVGPFGFVIPTRLCKLPWTPPRTAPHGSLIQVSRDRGADPSRRPLARRPEPPVSAPPQRRVDTGLQLGDSVTSGWRWGSRQSQVGSILFGRRTGIAITAEEYGPRSPTGVRKNMPLA